MRVERGVDAACSVIVRGGRPAADRGASIVEWGAMLLLVAAVSAVLVSVGGVPEQVSAGTRYAICTVTQGGDCEAPPGADQPPSQGGPTTSQGLDEDGYNEQLCRKLRLDCDNWDPDRGLSCNDGNIVPVYEYYAELSRDHPELQWAGMAKLAGGLVYAGMQDLHVLRKLNRDAREKFIRQAFPGMPGVLIDALAGASEAELKYFETKFVNMQKQIFLDMGWQHEAYATGGIAEMRRLDEAGQLPRGNIEAWEDIASGDPDRIKRGNEDLLFREQKIVLQDDYDDLKGHHGPLGLAVTYMLGLTAQSPVPGGQPFRDVVNTRVGTPEQVCTPWGWCQDIPSVGVEVPENIADFDSRWQWIQEDMLPQYQRLLEEEPGQVRSEIDRQLNERAQDYRLIPIGYNPQDGVC